MSNDREKLQPDYSSFEDLDVSFSKPSVGFVGAVLFYLQSHDRSCVITILSLVVIAVICYAVRDGWASFAITCVVVAFSTFVIVMGEFRGEEKNRDQ